jgi:hypothetical protein
MCTLAVSLCYNLPTPLLMSSSTDSDPFEAAWAIKGGAVAGILATIVMGVAISVMRLETLQLAIAGLYGQGGNLIAGWIAHLLHGTIFGVGFAGLLADPGLYRLTEWAWKTVLAGIVFGLLLALIGAGFVMPVWLNAVGASPVPPVPNVTVELVIWHLIYGSVLGAIFPYVENL